VKKQAPVTGEQIAESLGITRPTIRSDLSVLVMLGIIDAKPKVGYFLGKELSSDGMLRGKLQEIKVSEIMGRPIVIREDGTVNDAVIQLFIEHTSLLSVTDEEGLLTGIVSMKDLLKVTLGNPNAASIPIRMAMTRLPRVVTIGPQDTVLDAANKMIHNQIGGLPVVVTRAAEDEAPGLEIVGRITKTNILQVLLDASVD
jgi:CBS domain-containing protein